MAQMIAEPLVMLAEMPIKPDKRDEFLDYTTASLGFSRGAKGNITFDILVSDEEPEVVRFYEVWESREAQQAYMASRMARGDLAVLLSYLSGPPRFTALLRMEPS